jgi:hypothetical protein
VAGNKPVQHARRKGIAGANPVDDSRDEDFIGCKSRVAGVDPCRNAMAVGVVQMAGGRCNRLQLREGFEGSEAASRRRSSPSPPNPRPRSSEISR